MLIRLLRTAPRWIDTDDTDAWQPRRDWPRSTDVRRC